MALSLITGGSGAGKTEYIYKKVIDWSMKEPQRQFFVIVPEQSTMQGQKDIVRLHPRRGTMNIDIVSFERLAYRIFGELSPAGDPGRYGKDHGLTEAGGRAEGPASFIFCPSESDGLYR